MTTNKIVYLFFGNSV